MCIRDRVEAQHTAAMLTTFNEIDMGPVMELRKRRQEAFVAVSYTHLRAHETVLDLVCRLLLEKKNK